MKRQEKIVAKENRPRMRHYQREEGIANQSTIVENDSLQRESVTHNQVDEPTSTVKDSEK